MSEDLIEQVLGARLNGMSPAREIAWPGIHYAPPAGGGSTSETIYLEEDGAATSTPLHLESSGVATSDTLQTESNGVAGWLEVQHFRNRPRRMTLDRLHVLEGIYQVTVVWPKGRGPEALEEAAAVAERFAADQRLSFTGGFVRVQQRPHVAGGLASPRGWEIPVSVYYEAHGL